jgi:hypothetical protein
MYTYGGDANLDGVITGDDYAAIDFGDLTGGTDAWVQGDFNYDGVINGDDYLIIDQNLSGSGSTTGSGTGGVTAVG